MEEKKSIKVSLETVVCLFIIVLLIIGLVGMYLYYNKNNSNIIVFAWLLCCVWLFATLWTAACQAPLSFTVSAHVHVHWVGDAI